MNLDLASIALSDLIEVLIDGILFGLQLSLLAVGLVLIFGLGGILNLAHGEFVIVTGVISAVLISSGWNPAVAILAGILFSGILALALDRSVLRPVYRLEGEMEVLVGLFVTLGLAFTLEGITSYLFPGLYFSVRVPVETVSIFGLSFRASALVSGMISFLSLMLLLLFLGKTMTGKAIRAALQNQTGSKVCGIDVDRMRSLVFFLGGLMAGLAALAKGIASSVEPGSGLELTSYALIVGVVGGVRSVYGAMVAGILLGIVNALAGYLLGTYLTLVILLAIVVAVILYKPSGLFAGGV